VSTPGLAALQAALVDDDKRLLQGATTSPPPLMCVQDWPVEAACAVTLTGWLGDGLSLVGEAEEYFGRMCYECDQAVGEPAGCRWFLNFWDETPRKEAIALLLPEVEAELVRRRTVC
jgi:hypothetical protein